MSAAPTCIRAPILTGFHIFIENRNSFSGSNYFYAARLARMRSLVQIPLKGAQISAFQLLLGTGDHLIFVLSVFRVQSIQQRKQWLDESFYDTSDVK